MHANSAVPGRHRLWLIILLTPLIYGCASLSTVPPEQFDLSGEWRLNSALSDSPILNSRNRGDAAKGRQDGNRGATGQRPPRQRPGGDNGRPGRSGGTAQAASGRGGAGGRKGGNVRVGALESNSLEIEQSEESMGMQFDHGVYRDVSWGERVRGRVTVNSGWDERVLVIRSKGGPVPVVERYSLSADGQRLSVAIELNGGRNEMSFLRVFDRITPAPTSPQAQE